MPDTALFLSPLRLARRDKILTAAQSLFTNQGFRATTMEGVAAAARMSKATLYGYFQDKDALFEAVANRVADQLLEAVQKALDQPGAPEIIVADALCQKHTIVWDIARGSVFSSELFEAKTRFANSAFERLDDQIEKEIAATLRRHRIAGSKAKARLLFGAARGVADHAKDRAQMRRDITALVEAVLADRP